MKKLIIYIVAAILSIGCFAQTDCLDFTNITEDNSLISRKGQAIHPKLDTLKSIEDTSWLAVVTDTSLYYPISDNNATDITKLIPTDQDKAIRMYLPDNETDSAYITYEYFVDTSKHSILLLRIAELLEKSTGMAYPNGFDIALSIKDEQGKTVLYGGHNLMYYHLGNDDYDVTIPNSNAKYVFIPYDNIFIDLAPYHNQNVKIGLRCSLLDNMSSKNPNYMFFNLVCLERLMHINSEYCGADSVSLKADVDFDIEWRSNGTSYSTDKEIKVAFDDKNYCCYLRSDGEFKSLPKYTIVRCFQATKYYPVADWEYEIDTCKSLVHFKNKSYVAAENGSTQGNAPIIDSVEWITENGTVFTGYDYDLRIDKNQHYTIKLAVHMNDWHCSDTIETEFDIDFNVDISVGSKDTVCENDTLILVADTPLENVVFVWNDGTEGNTDTVVAKLNDTVYSVVAYINDTCQGTVYKDVKVMPVLNDTLFKQICLGETVWFNGNEYSQSGIYTDSMVSVFGCDSISTLSLDVRDTFYISITSLLCDSGYYDNGFNAEESGLYYQNLQSIYGCDSTIELDFTRANVFRDTIDVTIYNGSKYSDDNFTESEKGTYIQTYTDINGCDSMFVLNLDILEFKFPTAVTPNGDGINDIFEIKGIDGQTMFDNIILIVYNRMGKVIYKTENPQKKEDFWNPADQNAPTGTYFYRFTATGKQEKVDFTGSIEVLY